MNFCELASKYKGKMVQNARFLLKIDVKIKCVRPEKGQKACFCALFFARRGWLGGCVL